MDDDVDVLGIEHFEIDDDVDVLIYFVDREMDGYID